MGILLLLAAALLGIVGAAGPWLKTPQQQAITVIVDRGASMSARGAGGVARFVEAARLVGQYVPRANVVVVPPVNDLLTGTDWAVGVAKLPRTALDTSALLAKAAREALSSGGDPVVVVSDQPVEKSPRLVEIGPMARPANAGIMALAVRVETAGGKAQVMVSIASNMPDHDADLTVTSDTHSATQHIHVPKGASNYFLTLDGAGDVVQAELSGSDDWEANHRAWVVRHGAWPRVEARGQLPPALRRMVDDYQANRRPSESSAVVGVSAGEPMADAGLIWTAGISPVAGDGALQLGDPQLTGDVNWTEMLADVHTTADLPAGAGWTPVVSRGASVLIARRQQPARQVWVGFWSDDWASRAGFVVFCTRALDWLGGGGQTFDSRGPGQLPAGWSAATLAPCEFGTVATERAYWPGVYRRGATSLLAVNAGSLPDGRVVEPGDWERMGNLRKEAAGQDVRAGMAPELLAVAALLAAAALLWLGFALS